MININKSIQWAQEFLLAQGYVIYNPPENIQIKPWSRVTRFLTSAGNIYLKQTPPALALEPLITQILYNQYHANVPLVIAINSKLNCFLMKDFGIPLREYFKDNFQSDLLCQVINKYTAIQCAVREDIKIFLELGVPDWRLKRLPDLYSELICQENLLQEDGLTIEELDVLGKLQPEFSFMCESLFFYKIPETLDHCDFHDNNILIDNNTKNMTIIDLGETVITHPFFSLITALRNARFRYSLEEMSKKYLEIKNACLENFIVFDKKNNLLEAFSLAEKLWPIYASLGEYRLMMSCDAQEFKSLDRRGLLAIGFKEFIKQTS